MERIRLVVAEQPVLALDALSWFLESREELTVLGKARTGTDALDLARSERPDVLVLDWMLAELNSRRLLQQVRKQSPRTRTVVIARECTELAAFTALRGGARAFVPKEGGTGELLRGIHEAAGNRTFVGAPLSLERIHTFSMQPQSAALQAVMRLTPRRRQILALAAEGLANRQIAERLGISMSTVARLVFHALHALGLTRRTQVGRYLLKAQKQPVEPESQERE